MKIAETRFLGLEPSLLLGIGVLVAEQSSV